MRYLTSALLLCSVVYGQGPSATESAVLREVDAYTPASVSLLEKLVNVNSGTFNPPGVLAVAKLLEPEFQRLGFATRFISMEGMQRGPHLVAERKGNKGKRVLLIGHLDTVFEPSSPFRTFVREGDRATGPGTSDMKGGIVVMLSALQALHKAGALENSSVTVFLTGDEESAGVPTSVSRKEFIEAGKASDAALCFEGGVRRDGKDYASTARRGSTTWELRVRGQTGHSSGIFSERVGDGAIYEASRIIDQFRQTLQEPNLTYSVGMIAGGSAVRVNENGEASVSGKANIIPGEAVVIGDIRALTPEQLGRVKDKMHSIVSRNLNKTSAELRFKDAYPPMAPTKGNAALLDRLNAANRVLGLPEMEALDPMLRGAGDISFVAEHVDSLSGLGANGGGSHAAGEWVDLSRLPLQAKRAALLIHQLIEEPR